MFEVDFVEVQRFKPQVFFDNFFTELQIAFHTGKWHQNSKALFSIQTELSFQLSNL